MLSLHSSSRLRLASGGRSAVASRLPLDLSFKSRHRNSSIALSSSRPRSVAISAALTASYSPGSKQCLAQAQEAAWQSGCPDIELRHVLLGLIAADQTAQMLEIPRKFIWPSPADVAKGHCDESSSGARVTLAALLEQFGMPLDDIRRTLDTTFSDSDDNSKDSKDSKDSNSGMHMEEAHEIVSEEVLALLRLAKKSAIMQGSDVVEPSHLLWALLQLPSSSSVNSPFSRLFQELAVRAPGAVMAVLHQVASLPVPLPGLPLLSQAGERQVHQLTNQQLTTCPDVSQFLRPTPGPTYDTYAKSLTQVLENLELHHLGPGLDVFNSIRTHIQPVFQHTCTFTGQYSGVRQAFEQVLPLLKAAMKLGIRVPSLGRSSQFYGYASSAFNMYSLNVELKAANAMKCLDALETLAWHGFFDQSTTQPVLKGLTAQLLPDVDILKRLLNVISECNLPLSTLSLVSGSLNEVRSWLCANDGQSKQTWTTDKAELFCFMHGSSNGPRLNPKGAQSAATGSSEQSHLAAAASCPAGSVSRSAAALAQVIHSSMKSPDFEPRHAQAAITTLMQLGYDPGAEWMSDFLTYFKVAAPCMSVDQLVLCLEAVASFPGSKYLLQPATATLILHSTAAGSSCMSAEQQLTVLKAVQSLGVLEKLQTLDSWSTRFQNAGAFYNSTCDKFAAATLNVMREESRLKSRLANDLGISSDTSRVTGKGLHRSANRASLTQQSGTAAFCQALMQQYCSGSTAADAPTAGTSVTTATTTATPQTLASTMLTWVLASSRSADSHYEAEAAAATRMPSDADSAALFSASLSIPSTEISARHALMLAWGAAVMGLQPPEGWLAKMWKRVQPELLAPESGWGGSQPAVGMLAESERLLVIWAFSGLQQAGSQRSLLRAATLLSPDTASPLALSAALWTLVQSGSSSQVPAGWLDQAAEALIRALSRACEGLGAGSSSSSSSSNSGGGGGSSNGLLHNEKPAASAKAGGPQVSQQSVLKAAIAGLMCLGQTGYRVGADRVKELQEVLLPRIGCWTAKHSHSTDTAAAEVRAALAAVGITM